MVNSVLRQILVTALPYYCVLCGLRSERDVALCAPCEADLEPNLRACQQCALPLAATLPDSAAPQRCGSCQASPPPFDSTTAPWLYDERIAHLVQRWKFQKERSLTSLFSHLWCHPVTELPPVDVITPVPLHWLRQWQRGYNQAGLLAHALHRSLNPGLKKCHGLDKHCDLNLRLLRRARSTAAQSGMNAIDRSRNLRGAFTVNKPCDNLRIALVDDVMTTTATAAAAAKALKTAGAREVHVWCIARTPSPGV